MAGTPWSMRSASYPTAELLGVLRAGAPPNRSTPSSPGYPAVRPPSTRSPRTASAGTDRSRLSSHRVRSLEPLEPGDDHQPLRRRRAQKSRPRCGARVATRRPCPAAGARTTRAAADREPLDVLAELALQEGGVHAPSARTTSRAIRVTVGAVTPSVFCTVAAMPYASSCRSSGSVEPRPVADLAGEAEAAGWDGCSCGTTCCTGAGDRHRRSVDHARAAVAMATERVRIGPMVTPPPPPAPEAGLETCRSTGCRPAGSSSAGRMGGDPGGELTASVRTRSEGAGPDARRSARGAGRPVVR